MVSEHWTALANWRGAGIAEEAQLRNCPHPKAEVANQPHLPSHSQNHSSQVKSQSLSTLLITSKREESSYQLFLSRQLKRAAIEIEAVFRPQIHPLSIQEASRFKVPFTTGTFQSNTFQSIMVDHRQSPRGADFYPSSTSSSSSNAPASSPHLSAHPPHPHAHRQQQTSPMPSNLNHHQVARNNSLAPQASHNPEFHQQQQQQRSNSYSHSTPNYNSSPSMSFSAPNTDTLNAYRARPVAPPRGGEGGAARDVRPSPRLSQQQPGMLSSNPSSSSDQASAYSTGSGDRGGGGTSEMGGNASTSSGQDPRLNGQSGHPSMPTGMTYQPSGGFVGQQGSRGAFPSMQESTGGDGHSNAYYSQSPYQQQQQSSTSTYPQNQYQSHPSQEMYSPVSTSGSHSNPSHPSHQASYAAYPATGGHGNGQPQPSSSHPHSSNQQLPPTPTQSDAPVPGQTPESRGTKRKSSAGQETHPQQQPPLPTNPQSNYNYSDTASSSASSAYGHPPAPSYGGGGYSAYPAHLYPSGTAPGTGGGPSGSPYGLPYPSFGGGYGAYPSDPRSQAQGMGGGDPAQSQRTSVGSNSSDPGGMAGMVAHQQQQQQQNQLQFQQHHPGNPYYGYNYGAYAHPQGSHPNPQMRYPQQFHPSDPHSYHSQHNLLATPDYGYGRVAPGTFGAPRPNKPPPPAKPAPKARSASISKPKKSPPPPPASKAPSKSQLNPPKKSPSAWQLYFADDLSEYKSKMKEGDKLNVANVAKEAAVRYKVLDEKKKVAYRTRAEELKLGWDKEMAAWKETLSPKDIAQENAFRAAQRKAGKSRKSNIKDPNAPQKPLSAYFLFLRKIRADKELQKEIFQNEHETTKQSVLAASRWRSMTAEEKTVSTCSFSLHFEKLRNEQVSSKVF